MLLIKCATVRIPSEHVERIQCINKQKTHAKRECDSFVYVLRDNNILIRFNFVSYTVNSSIVFLT